MTDFSKYDYIIVGAGITGLTIARLKAEEGKKCLIIEKRDHIGGNAYSEPDPETGIEVHKYGAHLFHCDDERVWKFVNHFSKWTNYVHRVWTTHNNEVFPLPINLGTINQYFRAHYSPDEARALIKNQSAAIGNAEPRNLEEQGVHLIGKSLFDAFIKNYTAKQWETPASELSADIIKRLPVRYNYNNRYFANKYEGLPADGYKKFFENIADHENITILLNTDYLQAHPSHHCEQPEYPHRHCDGSQNPRQTSTEHSTGSPRHVVPRNDRLGEPSLRGFAEPAATHSERMKVIYCGPIDEYFEYEYGELNWRSLRFEREVHDTVDFQGCPVMNYADLEPAYTRIHEFKHFHPERIASGNPAYNQDKTVIVKEYPAQWSKGEEAYYPVNTADDQEKLAKYRTLAAQTAPNVTFAGRLGNYAYYDMDKAFLHAFEVASNV